MRSAGHAADVLRPFRRLRHTVALPAHVSGERLEAHRVGGEEGEVRTLEAEDFR